MGRQRVENRSTLTLGDFVVKRGMRTRQKRLKWKKRDDQRTPRKQGQRLMKRTKGSSSRKKKYRAVEQLAMAREIEDLDRREELKQAQNKNATAGAAVDERYVMSDVANTLHRKNSEPMLDGGSPLVAPPAIDEEAFREHIVDCVLQTLFAPKAATSSKLFAPQEIVTAATGSGTGAGAATPVQLDELDQMSMRRIVERALFWKARQQPSLRYSQLYWFVPDDGIVECFVTPRVITHIFEELLEAEEPLERGLRVMLLKVIHSALPTLRHAILRSLHEWASALHQQQQQIASRKVGDSEGATQKGQGLVRLWADLVQRYSSGGSAGGSDGSGAASAEEQAATPAFADPAMLLSRSFGSFLKSRQLLVQHGEILTEAVQQLVGWRPILGYSVLSLLLAKWPRRSSGQELAFVRLLGALLGAMSPDMAFRGSGLLAELTKRLSLLIQSPHERCSMEAMEMVGNMYILLRYVVAHPAIASAVSKALCETARSHWSTRVKERADKMFDQMLDYA